MNLVRTAGRLSGHSKMRLTGFSLVLSLVMVGQTVAAAEPSTGVKTESPAAHDEVAKANAAKLKTKLAQKLAQASPPECQRIGQRVIAALSRDDSGAALQFHTFYMAFNCSKQELTQAFGCLVNLQAAVPSLSNPTPQQVAQCWADPSTLPEVVPPVSEKQGAEAGGEKK